MCVHLHYLRFNFAIHLSKGLKYPLSVTPFRLTPFQTNLRADEYTEPLRFLRQIVLAIRDTVPRTFIVGVKLNSGDYVHGGFSEEHGLDHVRVISSWDKIDFIEVSGGDYEDPRRLRSFLLMRTHDSCRVWSSNDPSSVLQFLLA